MVMTHSISWTRGTLRWLIALMALLGASPLSRAQDEGILDASPVNPKTGVLLATTTTRVHRLDAQSYLQLPGQPVPTAQASRGTLQLDNAPAASTQTLMSFKVRDVNFLFTSAGVDTYVTGAGTYEITRSIGALTVIGQRMILDLRVGDANATQHFDSGLVPFSGNLGTLSFDVTLRTAATTTTGVTTLRVKASVAPSLRPYGVDMTRSWYREGCYDPCACVLASYTMGGTYSLVPLGNSTSANIAGDSAFVNIVFFAGMSTSTSNVRVWNGAGIYQRDNGPLATPLPTHRLRASLAQRASVTAVPQPVRYDSGWKTTTLPWPTIGIAIADNNFYCFNHVFDFVASPR